MTPQQLKNSILQMAVQGKLVPQNEADEPASVLLEKIRAEKERLIEEGKIKKEKPLPPITDEEKPFDIPLQWCLCRLGTICSKLTDGSHNPPPKRSKGYRVISAKNIKNGQIQFEENDRFTDKEGFEKENPRTNITQGDIILGIIGGSIGNTAIYTHSDKVIAQRSIAIISSHISNKFMKILLNSPLFQIAFKHKSNGTAQGGIYLGELSNMVVPLPPLAEQQRIVEKIEELQPLIAAYEKAYTRLEKINSEFPDKLKKSLLQEAVQGKLIPQNPSDEPVSILLEKIHAEKERLIKEGKIKKEKPLPPITDEEKPFKIPDSWEWVRLNDIAKNISAGGDKPKICVKEQTENCNIPVYSNGEKNNGLYGYTNEARIFEKSITVSGRGTIGFSCIRTEPYVPIVRLISIIPLSEISIYFLQIIFEASLEKGVGTSIQQLTVPMIKPKVFPLPPLAEQQRIVEFLDALLPKLDDIKFQ